MIVRNVYVVMPDISGGYRQKAIENCEHDILLTDDREPRLLKCTTCPKEWKNLEQPSKQSKEKLHALDKKVKV